jgi:DNA (cytosine-5)-methyltransferase 1
MRSIELFSGAGGLALGISKAGYHHEAIVEWNKAACDTVRYNKNNGVMYVSNWPIYESDVNSFNLDVYGEGIELLAGGPPCQPFSIGGIHKGSDDERNMFPAFIKAVRKLKPQAILVENVKGLLRESFAPYFNYILLQLEFPEVERKELENWNDHHNRLLKIKQKSPVDSLGLSYDISHKLLNAANYGVPQKRERVFIVGFRKDLKVKWDFPNPTHSAELLLYDKWKTGEYWEKYKIPKADRGEAPKKVSNKIRTVQTSLFGDQVLPWQTIRDALHDLPEPEKNREIIKNHLYVPGARVYPGHTGSPIDEPSKTIKAGVHGVPGG